MQIYFHSCLCSYLPRVPILVEDTVYKTLLVESVQMNVSNQITCNKRSASEVYLQWSLQQSNFVVYIILGGIFIYGFSIKIHKLMFNTNI